MDHLSIIEKNKKEINAMKKKVNKSRYEKEDQTFLDAVKDVVSKPTSKKTVNKLYKSLKILDKKYPKGL